MDGRLNNLLPKEFEPSPPSKLPADRDDEPAIEVKAPRPALPKEGRRLKNDEAPGKN